MIGSFVTWATAGFVSKSGVDGGSDGVFTLILAIIGAGILLGWRSKPRAISGTILIVLALLIAAIGIYDLIDIESSTVEFLGERADVIDAGWGLYMVVVGSLLLAGSGFALRRVSRD